MNSQVRAYSEQKKRNRETSVREYDEGRVELSSLPRALFVELTQGCNLKCPMCRPAAIAPHSRKMSDELFDMIAKTLFPTAELVDIRGWGESLILPEAISRIETVRAYGADLRVVSNMSFRRDAVLDALVEANARIDVSFDTSDEELVQQVRTGSRLDLISRNVKYLVDKFGHADNLSMLTTVQNPTIESLPALVDYVADLGVREVRLVSVKVDDESALGVSDEDARVDAAIKIAAAQAKARGLRLIAATQMGSLPHNPVEAPPCIHPWSYCYITYAGEVSFCDLLIGPSNAEYIIGDLNVSDFNAIWNGEEMVGIRSEHLGQRRATASQFSHCAYCYKNKYIDFEQIFDKDLSKKIVELSAA